MIDIKNIKKSYGNLEVLKGVDLYIPKGEVVSIVGKSGAGKSTLLHIIGTLDSPDSGEISINGQVLNKMKSNTLAKFRNEHIGFVFQFHHLLPEFTALENVCIPAFIKKTSEKDAKRRAGELLDYLGLSERMDHKPSQLSGGEQQRVAVARALMNQPSVILADEPSGNLDSSTSKELHELFFKLRKDFEQTFVIVTHNMELAQMSDRTLRMQDGLIVSEERHISKDIATDSAHLELLSEKQRTMADKVLIPYEESAYVPSGDDLIFSMDVQYNGEDAYVGIDVISASGEHKGSFVSKEKTGMEYISQYFSFREGPPLLNALEKLEKHNGLKAKLLIVDGHGIADPKRLGVASWLGVMTDIPSIGLAKESLLKFEGSPKQQRGSNINIYEKGLAVGVALRTQDDVAPVFISPGHKVTLQSAINIILSLSEGGYRIPDPLRRAEQAATAFALGEDFPMTIF